jgi:hypothetical protein
VPSSPPQQASGSIKLFAVPAAAIDPATGLPQPGAQSALAAAIATVVQSYFGCPSCTITLLGITNSASGSSMGGEQAAAQAVSSPPFILVSFTVTGSGAIAAAGAVNSRAFSIALAQALLAQSAWAGTLPGGVSASEVAAAPLNSASGPAGTLPVPAQVGIGLGCALALICVAGIAAYQAHRQSRVASVQRLALGPKAAEEPREDRIQMYRPDYADELAWRDNPLGSQQLQQLQQAQQQRGARLEDGRAGGPAGGAALLRAVSPPTAPRSLVRQPTGTPRARLASRRNLDEQLDDMWGQPSPSRVPSRAGRQGGSSRSPTRAGAAGYGGGGEDAWGDAPYGSGGRFR